MSGKNISPCPQFRILDMIHNLTDKPTEIARMLDVSPPAISFLLEKLEEKGLDRKKLSAPSTADGSNSR